MKERGANGRFRCDECCRVLDIEKDGHTDCGNSNWFCFRCGERLEDRAMIIAARIERKHGILIDETRLFWLAYGYQFAGSLI